MNQKIHLRLDRFIQDPYQEINIGWETKDGTASGSSQCEAWQGQHVIEQLERAGHVIKFVELFK